MSEGQATLRQRAEKFADDLNEYIAEGGEWWVKDGRDNIIEAYLQLNAAHVPDDVIEDTLTLVWKAAINQFGM